MKNKSMKNNGLNNPALYSRKKRRAEQFVETVLSYIDEFSQSHDMKPSNDFLKLESSSEKNFGFLDLPDAPCESYLNTNVIVSCRPGRNGAMSIKFDYFVSEHPSMQANGCENYGFFLDDDDKSLIEEVFEERGYAIRIRHDLKIDDNRKDDSLTIFVKPKKKCIFNRKMADNNEYEIELQPYVRRRKRAVGFKCFGNRQMWK